MSGAGTPERYRACVIRTTEEWRAQAAQVLRQSSRRSCCISVRGGQIPNETFKSRGRKMPEKEREEGGENEARLVKRVGNSRKKSAVSTASER